ncbi:apyrase [Entamoeba histolytica HM-3:IMSS]|uniref:Apyrase, putative n=6 Tax=Entamoeba histolytica TaxID=5759 RepID=C4M9M8_ENTH1|nr:apyrase, putative [Entamoeba histolytica HM-1:IMSS]EMD48558.1 apyrase, putative [Entamoeba histolytica KU27]EMS14134.1 apyrase [Entamoeba histolytica HM-3:IMSS]ENY60183.1 apyrase, putative [Entamoeba histolytica HM-1:IMSS-A]BAN38856.1 apyrase, putative [Entamoeba histolytica]EAL50771.1 apyrase, putative [Entamoeba histolytica HM-1:IMSS]|eukprot:XP_656157.1 apyrase, putative [Entamoeba histolytica HM-1:IMSS]
MKKLLLFSIFIVGVITLFLFEALVIYDYPTVSNSRLSHLKSVFLKSNDLVYPESMSGYSTYNENSFAFQLIYVTDNDKYNVEDNKFISKIHFGMISKIDNKWSFTENTQKSFQTQTQLNYNGRGNELSEVIQYFNNLYVFDDKTGVIAQLDLDHKNFYPWIIIADGNGNQTSGAKNEWATVVGDKLYVGSHGPNTYDSLGRVDRTNKYYIQKVNKEGSFEYEDWSGVYNNILNALNIEVPGYITNEAVVYSNLKKKWYFAPRKCSNKAYDKQEDEELNNCKYIIELDENLNNPRLIEDKQYDKTHGFSSIKVLPFNEDILVYLKSYEVDNKFKSFIGMINVNGEIVMEEQPLGSEKFEGLEIIPLNI